MKKQLFGLIALVSITANANALMFSFSADQVSVSPDASVSSIVDVAAGFPTITGIFSFDASSQVPFSSTIASFDYPTLTIDQFAVAGLGGFPGQGTTLYNDVITVGPVCCTDAILSGNDGFTPVQPPGLYEGFSFLFLDDTATAFSSLVLPAALDLADFAIAELYFGASEWRGTEFGAQESVTYRITRIGEVPLPGALPLFLTAFTVIAGWLGASRRIRERELQSP